MKSFVTLPSSSLIALLLIIAIDPIVISSGRASQPLPSPTFNIFKRDFQACHHSQSNWPITHQLSWTAEPVSNLIKLKPINDSNNVQNQCLRFNARRPLKENRRSGKLLMEEDYPQEELLKILARLLDWIMDQTLLSQEDQKGEDPVK
ncbi:hypothetical protein BY996DRAFT_6557982 [Phakopsora pachyrhizi]|nr:hypothetical protein BY996DRAFT_6557982 [Phakopsora pachyrhizi]